MLHNSERRTTTSSKVVKETETVAFVIGKTVGLKVGTASAESYSLIPSSPECFVQLDKRLRFSFS
jgi:hypothetical protein